jgi:anti-anti-sigma factor
MQPCSWEVTVVCVEHAIDGDNVRELKQQLSHLLSRTGHVVLDLRDATLDGSGLGSVLSLQRQLELQGRRLLVVSDDPRFRGLLEATGVSSTLSLFQDAEQAVSFARRQPRPELVA